MGNSGRARRSWHVYRIVGDYSTAQSHLEQSLQVYQEHGRTIWESNPLCALAENAISQGDLSAARTHLQAASTLLGTGENKWLQMLVCYFRGRLAHYEGDAAAATRWLEEAAALAREGQYKGDLARPLVALGRVKRTLGQVLPASELLMQGLDLFRTLGHKLGIAETIEELGALSAVQEDGVQAALLLSTAHALRQRIGAPIPPVDRAAYDSVVAACRAEIGEAAFAEAWARGAARPWQEVVGEVLNLRQGKLGSQAAQSICGGVMSNYELTRFTASIDAAWNDLRSFLAAVTHSQASKRDQAGWSAKDHVTHLAVWEDSAAILFRGGRRHEALGIEESLYAAGNFDDMNEVIRARFESATLQEAIRILEEAHKQLMGHLRTLRDADLNAKAREFFPQAPRNDERSLGSLLWDNTGGHFAAHLEWMRDLVAGTV